MRVLPTLAGVVFLASVQVAAADGKKVKLADLIAAPGKYDGQLVKTEGFLHTEFEGNNIYISEEDYNNRETKNSLWVESAKNSPVKITDELFNDSYVAIEGVFSASDTGHMGMSGGAIKEINGAQILLKH